MRAIVVVDRNWGIGKKNDLLFSLPADMKHFRGNDARKNSCNGQQYFEIFSRREAFEEQREYCVVAGW